MSSRPSEGPPAAREWTWSSSTSARGPGRPRFRRCGPTAGSPSAGRRRGPNPRPALHRIWWKQLTILGSTMGAKQDFEGAYELVSSGRARPVIDSVFPLAEARAAHERMESGEQFGKIVLRIPD